MLKMHKKTVTNEVKILNDNDMVGKLKVLFRSHGFLYVLREDSDAVYFLTALTEKSFSVSVRYRNGVTNVVSHGTLEWRGITMKNNKFVNEVNTENWEPVVAGDILVGTTTRSCYEVLAVGPDGKVFASHEDGVSHVYGPNSNCFDDTRAIDVA